MKRFFSKQIFWLPVTALVFSVTELPAADRKDEKADPVQEIMESYFSIGQLLASDSLGDIEQPRQKIASASEQILKAEEKAKEKKEYLSLVKAIQASAKKFISQDLKRARESYKALSEAVNNYVKAYGYSDPAYSFYCPMAEQAWLQSTEQIANPFYGSEMLKCGKMAGMVKDGKYVERMETKKKEHQH